MNNNNKDDDLSSTQSYQLCVDEVFCNSGANSIDNSSSNKTTKMSNTKKKGRVVSVPKIPIRISSSPIIHDINENDNNNTNNNSSKEASKSNDPLHCRNYFNIQFYAIYASLSFLLYEPTSEMRKSEYRTLFTPVEWVFYIWVLICISQGVFAIAQLLPRYRSSTIVIDGIKFWYVPICVFEVTWVLTMKDHAHLSAFFIILLLLLCLLCLIKSQNDIIPNISILQYFLFCFPFELHTAWIIGAMLINSNMAIKTEDENIAVQLTVAALSLHILLAIAICFLFIPDRPNYSIPLVLSWISMGIWIELRNPDYDAIISSFGQDTVTTMLENSMAITIIIWVLVFVRLSVAYLTRRTEITDEQRIELYMKECTNT